MSRLFRIQKKAFCWILKRWLLAELQAKMSRDCGYLLFWHHSYDVTLKMLRCNTNESAKRSYHDGPYHVFFCNCCSHSSCCGCPWIPPDNRVWEYKYSYILWKYLKYLKYVICAEEVEICCRFLTLLIKGTWEKQLSCQAQLSQSDQGNIYITDRKANNTTPAGYGVFESINTQTFFENVQAFRYCWNMSFMLKK